MQITCFGVILVTVKELITTPNSVTTSIHPFAYPYQGRGGVGAYPSKPWTGRNNKGPLIIYTGGR